MEQASLTKDLAGNAPPSPTIPAGDAPAALPGDADVGESAEEACFPDASGSLSSILASMGDDGDTRSEAVQPPAQAPSDKHRRKVPDPLQEGDNPYPDIMLMPLPRQDALRIKWGLGNGLPNVATLSEEELRRLAVWEAPDRKSGSLRLYGMLPSGAPWEARLSISGLEASPAGAIIGRDPSECTIVISEDSVSRRHALLQMTNEGLAISDLGSRNGTTVDDHALTRYDRQYPLTDGSTINLGEVAIRVELLV